MPGGYYAPTPVNPNFDEWVAPPDGYNELDQILSGLGEGIAVGLDVAAKKRSREDQGELSKLLYQALMSEGLSPALAALAASEFEKKGTMQLTAALQDVKGTAQKLASGEIQLKYLEPSLQSQLAGEAAKTKFTEAQTKGVEEQTRLLPEQLDVDRQRVLGGLGIERDNATTARYNAETQRMQTVAAMFDRNGNRRLDPEEEEAMLQKHWNDVRREQRDADSPKNRLSGNAIKKMTPEEIRQEAIRRTQEEKQMILEYFGSASGGDQGGSTGFTGYGPSMSQGAVDIGRVMIELARKHFQSNSGTDFFGAKSLQEVIEAYGGGGQ